MQKYYLYHRVPDDLEGQTLFPLNTLKEKYPELYDKKVRKYIGREFIQEQIIPTLNCLWNDVLHLSAIPPKDLKNALVEAGVEVGELNFYQIDPELLNPDNTTVYLYADTSNKVKMELENFAEYIPNEIEQYSPIPKETKEYYKKRIDEGEQPLIYVRVPHILFKGSIDVSNLPIITV
ncbi:hypothetical protein H7X65_00005 [Candidatus Parcubacteria bacterium]|nr:hypothetical protein [Candidatus Parcubacteria bacterium]